ncbi:MAG: DUF1573 domain-containing protein [Armatimonadetes bacterium]|nr:DUF1573 domain-containing protein [Armatimonadota bacterium]
MDNGRTLEFGAFATDAGGGAKPGSDGASMDAGIPTETDRSTLITFCEMAGGSVDDESVIRCFRKYAGQRVDAETLPAMAADLGCKVACVGASLGELRELDRPVLAYLQGPERLAILLDVGDFTVRLLDTGGARGSVTAASPSERDGLRIVARAEFSEAWSGVAWVVDRADEGKTPRCRFIQTDRRLDKTEVGLKSEQVFEFRNVGGEGLRVSLLRKWCACASVVIEPVVVRPGQGGKVTVALDGSGTESSAETVTLKTNDPFRSVVILGIRGSAAQPFW